MTQCINSVSFTPGTLYNLVQPEENNFDVKAAEKATYEMSFGRFSVVSSV